MESEWGGLIYYGASTLMHGTKRLKGWCHYSAGAFTYDSIEETFPGPLGFKLNRVKEVYLWIIVKAFVNMIKYNCTNLPKKTSLTYISINNNHS